MSDIKPVTSFPWQPQSEITGNLAIGNLRENLLQRLRDERGVHAETLVTAIGAITGFAAHNAALNRAATMTSQLADLPQFSNGLVLVETQSGEQYLFGDWINVHLFNDPGSQFPLYGLVAASAIQIGVTRKDLPDYEEIARHVVSVIGGPELRLLAELHLSRTARIRVAGGGAEGDAPDARASALGLPHGQPQPPKPLSPSWDTTNHGGVQRGLSLSLEKFDRLLTISR